MLFAWIGDTDRKAVERAREAGLGPIGAVADAVDLDEIVLLSAFSLGDGRRYRRWLANRTAAKVALRTVKLSDPTDFAAIYREAVRAVEETVADRSPRPDLVYQVSSGTPQMGFTWILVAQMRFPAQLVQSSRDHGVRALRFPFRVAAEFLDELLRERDAALVHGSEARPPEAPEFEEILHRCAPMRRLIERARRAALRDVPVLLLGESGTGKELLARAIHTASRRAEGPFVPVNCGAIPANLVESELFGFARGAFTGARENRVGLIEAAADGTLFLDEVGELPLDQQTRLLRVLQEGEVTPVGATKPRKVDLRVLAATNRNLVEDAATGRFREDLFYRLGVVILQVPPLRERAGDLGALLDHLLDRINAREEERSGAERKRLSVEARQVFLRHPWPGNVRELINTLHRAHIFSDGSTIDGEDALGAIVPVATGARADILGRPLAEGFNLRGLCDEVARHYLTRALRETGGNKARAARLLGFGNATTLRGWMGRVGIAEVRDPSSGDDD